MDPFAYSHQELSSPGLRHYTVTPGASDLDPKPRSLRANTSGTITIEDIDGTSIEYNVTQGEVIPFRGHKITAATAVVIAWY